MIDDSKTVLAVSCNDVVSLSYFFYKQIASKKKQICTYILYYCVSPSVFLTLSCHLAFVLTLARDFQTPSLFHFSSRSYATATCCRSQSHSNFLFPHLAREFFRFGCIISLLEKRSWFILCDNSVNGSLSFSSFLKKNHREPIGLTRGMHFGCSG